jgi:hypothetical protein
MVRADSLVVATNEALANPEVQARVREMHEEEMPLLDMVDELGLGRDMSPEIRAVIEGLSSDVVEGIRRATLDALDDGRTEMPLDCDITEAEVASGIDVDVVVRSAVGPTIQIRSS